MIEAGRVEAAGDAPSFILRVVQLRAVEGLWVMYVIPILHICVPPSYDQYLAVFEQRRRVRRTGHVECASSGPLSRGWVVQLRAVK